MIKSCYDSNHKTLNMSKNNVYTSTDNYSHSVLIFAVCSRMQNQLGYELLSLKKSLFLCTYISFHYFVHVTTHLSYIIYSEWKLSTQRHSPTGDPQFFLSSYLSPRFCTAHEMRNEERRKEPSKKSMWIKNIMRESFPFFC